jgi:hypothetical protein
MKIEWEMESEEIEETKFFSETFRVVSSLFINFYLRRWERFFPLRR